MEEELHRADHRIAIRGNVSDVSLPWEEIYGQLGTPPSEPTAPQTKSATADPASLSAVGGEAFQRDLRPDTLTKDWSAEQSADPTVQEVTCLAKFTPKMTIQTGNTFWDQWKTEYLAWAYPFSIPAPVGGPNFPNKDRPRRRTDAAMLGPVLTCVPLHAGLKAAFGIRGT